MIQSKVKAAVMLCALCATTMIGCYNENQALAEKREKERMERSINTLADENSDLQQRNQELETKQRQQLANAKNPAVQRKELADAELINWKSNLVISNIEWKNPVWGEPFVKATANNKATFISYGDIVVEAHFLSKVGTSLAVERQTIHEELLPLGSRRISFNNITWPPGTERVEVVVVDAKGLETSRIQ